MANKRVSELAPITAVELQIDDLLLISDVTEHESKKLALQDLGIFILSGGNLTGSLFGTASYAIQAATASYVGPHTASYAPTASWALNIATASYALAALSASYSYNGTYAITASYALTASVQLVYSSAFADYARTASYLLLTPGTTNGTASYALTASYFLGAAQVSSSYAYTSSWAFNIDTASRAISSVNADTASLVQTASFLRFQGVPNGTASYALTAGTIVNNVQDYGIFIATTQSISSSQLDMMTVTPALGGLKTTTVEVYGTIRIPFTSSIPTDGDIELFVVDRQYGFSQSLDASPVYALVGGADISGTLKYPFTLRGDADLYGLYSVYITASNGVYIESSRTARFKITSESDQLQVSAYEPMRFYTYPNNAILTYSSSLNPNVLYGSASQVTVSGSYDVTELMIPPTAVNIMQYTWTLAGLQKLVVDGNSGLSYIGGIPAGSVSMSAANCGLTELPLLSSSSISYLNVPNNTIVTVLHLPISMSYINIANNYYVSIPIALPQGLTAFIADGNAATYTPYVVPDSLQTMSFANCSRLNSFLAPSFPPSLKYWNSSGSRLLNNMPTTMPPNLIYMDVGSNGLPDTTISNIASGLVANSLSNGYLSILNNFGSASAFGIVANVATLKSRGWTVLS